MKKDDVSFLDDTQREGKASGKVEVTDLDKAIEAVHIILDKETVQTFREKKEEDLPTAKMVVYCHDCDEIVPAGVGKTLRGKPRTVCGNCKSKKISMGQEEAIRKFYHLDKKKD
ncbi:hypothetical protein K9M59_01130 [Candidatus Gracilibacteria bacterium]|nr:hypothetical protein [Candidatus Gracilibacteria bacterium]MCF7819171.1 hypothetical protein [Candidatus Gracilibacteria bacterium]